MQNIKLTLAYDGTDFRGWQRQPDQPTIQGEVTNALETITQQPVSLQGAGRTDAGVHAAGQVANFTTDSALPAAEFQRALNAMLPPTIRVMAAREVSLDFHARWHATAKTYRYRIFRDTVVPPSLWRFVHRFSCALDFQGMSDAAAQFAGEHDFSSFAGSSDSEAEDEQRNMMRVIFSSAIVRVPGREAFGGEEWVYEVRGKSFLRYMVRKIVGTLVEVGRGKLKPSKIATIFELRDPAKSGPTMPPCGLSLVSVEYPD